VIRAAAGVVLAAAILAPAIAAAQDCPAAVQEARRLVLVTAHGMATSAASLRLFERGAAGERWHPVGTREPARIGTAGMAWGYPYRALAQNGEPLKIEGDKRAPAGIYRIGRSFGFAASPRPGYLRLTPQTICVDDAASPAYNTITTRAAVGPKVHGEMMRAVQRYRRGLVVDYPTHAAARAGSCIFIHVWRTPTSGTSGCVALPEDRVARLQEFVGAGAAIAILPERATERLAACLPGVN
jgi:L,D-peptidoglycan transpeptidase YkuD (ErfK/YbiS/YcfS/YnhG family)